MLIVATLVFELDHVTSVLMFCVVPSPYVAVAVYCCVVPLLTLALAGVTAMELSFSTVRVAVWVVPA